MTRESVLETLRDCYDPEIPVNVVDLGLVHDVRVTAGRVRVLMTLTSRFCPMAEHMANEVRERLVALDGVAGAEVELVWDPPWTPARMTDAGRRELGMK
ncbi:DUF59 domain-containing protein [Actinomadura sp. KC216]|nr:DUF59 domain-containing protein [Actinomadura sp. KC216]